MFLPLRVEDRVVEITKLLESIWFSSYKSEQNSSRVAKPMQDLHVQMAADTDWEWHRPAPQSINFAP
jgi:hypothetical protein